VEQRLQPPGCHSMVVPRDGVLQPRLHRGWNVQRQATKVRRGPFEQVVGLGPDGCFGELTQQIGERGRDADLLGAVHLLP
jgi:hypothetical protein